MWLGHIMCCRWATGEGGRRYYQIHQLSTSQNSPLSSSLVELFSRNHWMKWPFYFFIRFSRQTSCLPLCAGQWVWPFHLWVWFPLTSLSCPRTQTHTHTPGSFILHVTKSISFCHRTTIPERRLYSVSSHQPFHLSQNTCLHLHLNTAISLICFPVLCLHSIQREQLKSKKWVQKIIKTATITLSMLRGSK